MELTSAAAIAKITDKITGSLISAGARQAKKVILGDAETTALRTAVIRSASKAVGAYQAVGQISAEIDLFGDPSVVDEVARASATGAPAEWSAAEARWTTLFETDPPPELRLFLADLAAELGPRLRSNEHLRKLHAIWTLDHLVGEAGETKSIVLETGKRVGALSEEIAALIDPARAIRGIGAELGNDIPRVSEILAELGSQINAGALGRFDLAVKFGKNAADIELRPRPGVRAESEIRMVVADTAQGRAQLDAVRSALERGERVELPNPDVTLIADGEKLRLPEGIRMFAGPVVERHHATMTFISEGLEPLRSMATLDVTVRPNEIYAESAPGANDPLLVKLTVHPDGTMEGSFRGNDRVKTVANQVKANEFRRRVARGGVLELWIAEKDAFASMTFDADPTVVGADEAVETLRLFLDVQTALNIEVGEVEGLTENDLVWLGRAKSLLAGDAVYVPSHGSVVTVRSDTNVAETMAEERTGDGNRTMIWINESDWVLPLTRHPLPFGPVTLQSAVIWPPTVTRDEDQFVVRFECDPEQDAVLTRGLSNVLATPEPDGAPART